MISISQMDQLSAAACQECAGIKDYCLVASEAELKDVMRQVTDYPLLLTAHPSADGQDEGMDNVKENNILVFMVLSPMKETFSREQRTQVWDKTQVAMTQLKEFLYYQITGQDAIFYPFLWDARFSQRTIDPEYNVQGLVGWSLRFEATTSGL